LDILCRKVLDHPRLAIVNILGCRFHMSDLTRLPWNRDVLWLVSPSWCVSADPNIVGGVTRARDNLPDSHSICILVNEPEDEQTFGHIDGVSGQYISNNVFHPVDLFTIQNREKFFDAAVNAYAATFKRTHLCARIENLCCMRRSPESTDFSRDDMYDAALLKPKIINYRHLPRQEVIRFLNESYCGVILSAVEGECRAAAEYLYCGLPVVSTPSQGGRAAWFDDYNSIIVEPDELAVRDAVLELKGRMQSGAVSASTVRSNALALRTRFLARAESMIGDYLEIYGLAEETTAHDVVAQWLASIERDKNGLLRFEDAAAAFNYISRTGP